ncbi:glutamate synthase (NADPH), homotetrameric [candidate division WOR-3 bacterium JGI_Cruoil_03_44_89]|uniref:Glutamate synthase (NADPH), homotetrameric n=1 Tax=candidate division WOR-3 bacterium JGI_Cruoil_03_44_89 TaxID=1973748 RepID=A0A235BR18_UNCW3|nr:MAG: glutamate synthase (NADPH), homotetrameric [candidate division WOR-3 bacterium JGI_Cruoil_03_44_89]
MPRPAPKKVIMREQPPKERIKNFNEVPYGYSPEEAIEEAKRCLGCKKRPCVEGCPVEIDIPGFIKAIAEGDFRKAIKIMKGNNALPAICGRVCPQEEQCEKCCIVGKIKNSEPVAIGRLERFIADWEAEQGKLEIPPRPTPTGKKVAVVGAGPAGLTVAGDLAKLGHEVVIFEALHKPGGVLMYGIPEFRLPKKIVEREVNYIRKLGAKLVTSFVVGRTETVEELLGEFDAVFVGTGAGLPWFMNIPGENYNGIYSANEYLTRSNLMRAYLFPKYDTPIIKGKRVAVIGGGNVTIDSARTALRLGAEHSMVIYRRSKKEMPARNEEIAHAEDEGVEFHLLNLPVRYYADENGWVKEMECIKMRLGEPDASGRRRPIPIEGSNFKIPVDAVVVAIGQSPNPLIPQSIKGLEVGRHGNIIVDPATGKSSYIRVWAGGDIATGAATVILAMGAGRVAARSIDEYLRTGKW